MKEVEGGGVRRRKLVETKLRSLREEDEAAEALLAEEEASARRMEKMKRLKEAWRKRMDIREENVGETVDQGHGHGD